jgi:uncharacterized protein (DUF2147 family)
MKKRDVFAILTTLFMSVLVSSHLFAATLVAYWSFDEGTGKVVKDESDNGNDGEVVGTKWADGKLGKAMEFKSKGDYVLIKNDDSYNFKKGDSFTICLWINYEEKGDWQGPLQKFNGGYPFKVEVEPDNDLYFAIYDGTNFPKAFIGNVSGKWHQCCFVRDVKTDKLYAYLDGELKEDNPDTTTAEIANAADLYIGARKPGNSIGYVGLLDEIAIYSGVLTEDEIRSAADGKLPGTKQAAVQPLNKLATTWAGIKSAR